MIHHKATNLGCRQQRASHKDETVVRGPTHNQSDYVGAVHHRRHGHTHAPVHTQQARVAHMGTHTQHQQAHIGHVCVCLVLHKHQIEQSVAQCLQRVGESTDDKRGDDDGEQHLQHRVAQVVERPHQESSAIVIVIIVVVVHKDAVLVRLREHVVGGDVHVGEVGAHRLQHTHDAAVCAQCVCGVVHVLDRRECVRARGDHVVLHQQTVDGGDAQPLVRRPHTHVVHKHTARTGSRVVHTVVAHMFVAGGAGFVHTEAQPAEEGAAVQTLHGAAAIRRGVEHTAARGVGTLQTQTVQNQLARVLHVCLLVRVLVAARTAGARAGAGGTFRCVD
jgi:hypothetical protein